MGTVMVLWVWMIVQAKKNQQYHQTASDPAATPGEKIHEKRSVCVITLHRRLAVEAHAPLGAPATLKLFRNPLTVREHTLRLF